jgi:hypothetical protein
MAELAKSLKDLAFEALQSMVCLCGTRKQQGRSFCYGCFNLLPGNLKRNLWRSLHDGYAEVWDEACTFLKAETERIPR